MKKIVLILCLVILSFFIVCAGYFYWFATAFSGGHGKIKAYQFPVSKYILATAVNNIMESDTAIHINITRSYYNDIHNYFTFTIKDVGNENEYIVRYYGDSTFWNTSSTSEIFICYIYDEKGNGGSEGRDNWAKTPDEIKKKMVALFESKFISKIDKTLNKAHTENQ
ncbi:MAG: hypothetical protein ACYDCN_16820 [Bacteroidia bacterium]